VTQTTGTTRWRPRGIRTGVVDEFDEPRGLGNVMGDDGRRYPFHCTAVADGSRRIEVGMRVAFLLAAGHLGRVEAGQIVPAPLVRGLVGPGSAT
jgi:cold shock CspA family protein